MYLHLIKSPISVSHYVIVYNEDSISDQRLGERQIYR